MLLTERSTKVTSMSMVRPREFDRDAALAKAIEVFHAKGFAATSTHDLLRAMGIGRQSLYNAFGDKRSLYLEALQAYQQNLIEGHLSRLSDSKSPIAGIQNMLKGLIHEDDHLRSLGCMGVGSVGEFGVTDPDLIAMREKVGIALALRLIERIKDGQKAGEIDPDLNPPEIAGFVQMTMTGMQLASRGGASAKDLQKLARFSIERLRAK